MATVALMTSGVLEKVSRHGRMFGLVSLAAWFVAFYVLAMNSSLRPSFSNAIAFGLLVMLFLVVNVHIAVLRWTSRRDWSRAVALLYSSTYLSEIRGLPDRDTFVDELEREMNRARESGNQFALAIVSLESLELIRKDKGEGVARKAVKQLADRVLRAVRASDLAGYIGEGKVAVILSDTTYDEALQFVRRIPCEVLVSEDREAHQFDVLLRLKEFELEGGHAPDLLSDAEQARAMRLTHILQMREAA